MLGVFGGVWSRICSTASRRASTCRRSGPSSAPADFLSGVAKTVVFGFGIALVGCHVGITTTGGTAGVGRATTRAVVIASIGVLVSDFFLTKLLLLLPIDALLRGLVGLFR